MSMTALVSAFCRTYHSERDGAKFFDSTYAVNGAPFFVPDLWRNAEQALCLLVK